MLFKSFRQMHRSDRGYGKDPTIFREKHSARDDESVRFILICFVFLFISVSVVGVPIHYVLLITSRLVCSLGCA